jgi:signal peptidase I
VDFLLGGSPGQVPKIGDLRAVRVKIAKLRKQAREHAIQELANAAIIVCDQMLHGVAWSTTALKVYDIPSESMIPALKPGDKVLVNRISYKVADPKRGAIVVFKAPATSSAPAGQDLVKRIVGLPGETIEGRDGRILIDGRVIREPYLAAKVESRTFGPELIPAGQYFMLGDNRPYSQDSAYFGPIARGDLIGPATKL